MLVIEDKLDHESFSPRSSIHVRSVKSGNAVVTHTRSWTEKHTKALQVLLITFTECIHTFASIKEG